MLPLRDHNPSQSFPLVTLLLIAANAYGFWRELVAPDLDALLFQYALVPATVDFTQPATLLPFLTAMFLHGGWLHILSNMWFLWIFGDNIEDRFGKVKYLLVYLGSGIVAGLAQYIAGPESTIPMLGASGAVAGVLGAYIVFFPQHKIDTLVPFFGWLQVVQLPATVMLGYWFIIQLFSGVGSIGAQDVGGVAFWAHVGGFVTGFLVAKLSK